METIRTYVENMFACLPDTAEMQDLKQEILSNMEEKYNELKESGSSEPEAVSRVIADFGDIDEILDSYHIRPEETGNTQRLLSREEAECYVTAKHSANRQTGAGVMLCILAPALMLLFFMLMPGSRSDDPSVLGIILGFSSLFLSIAIGVSLFILSETRMEKYKYVEKEDCRLSASDQTYYKQLLEDTRIPSGIYTAAGVVLCVLSPISVILFGLLPQSSSFPFHLPILGVVILLFLIACAVYLFITGGSADEPYKCLLQEGEFSKQKKKERSVSEAIGTVVWPLSVAVYVILGFTRGLWGTAWIIFPIAGIGIWFVNSVITAIQNLASPRS